MCFALPSFQDEADNIGVVTIVGLFNMRRTLETYMMRCRKLDWVYVNMRGSMRCCVLSSERAHMVKHQFFLVGFTYWSDTFDQREFEQLATESWWLWQWCDRRCNAIKDSNIYSESPTPHPLSPPLRKPFRTKGPLSVKSQVTKELYHLHRSRRGSINIVGKAAIEHHRPPSNVAAAVKANT